MQEALQQASANVYYQVHSLIDSAEDLLVYEMLGLSSETDGAARHLAGLFCAALAHYRVRDWSAAIRDFEQVLKTHPDDPPARHMIDRIRQYQQQAPAADWNGVPGWLGLSFAFCFSSVSSSSGLASSSLPAA